MQMNALRLSLLTGGWKANNSYATFEHIIPKSKGGKKKDVLAHASCNRDRPQRRFAHDPVYGAARLLTAPLDSSQNKA